MVKRLTTPEERSRLVNEKKIKAKLREIAIKELKKSGDIPQNWE